MLVQAKFLGSPLVLQTKDKRHRKQNLDMDTGQDTGHQTKHVSKRLYNAHRKQDSGHNTQNKGHIYSENMIQTTRLTGYNTGYNTVSESINPSMS